MLDFLTQGFKDIISAIGNIASSVASAIKDILKELFVPDENPFIEIKDTLDAKFSFIGDIGDSLASAFSDNSTSTYDYQMTYKDTAFKLIDFSLLGNYVTYVRTFLKYLLWGAFILKFYKKLPSTIGGVQ